jgi:hypothetical protein
MDAKGVLTILGDAGMEQLPTIRKLVTYLREERRIWVTRDVCNEALNLAKVRDKGYVTTQVLDTALDTKSL